MDGARERWTPLVRRWQRSGQTACEFAQAAGVNPSTLTYWAWRLKRESEGSKGHGVTRQGSKAEVDRGSFVELVASPVEEQRFEIELVDGRRLRIPTEFDAAALGRLLAVLGGTGQ